MNKYWAENFCAVFGVGDFVVVFLAICAAMALGSLAVDAFERYLGRGLPRFAPDIDPTRYDEYEAAIAKLRANFTVHRGDAP